jgi:hypothetical protein
MTLEPSISQDSPYFSRRCTHEEGAERTPTLPRKPATCFSDTLDSLLGVPARGLWLARASSAPWSAGSRRAAGALRQEHAHSARSGTHARRAADPLPSPSRESSLVLLAKAGPRSPEAPCGRRGCGLEEDRAPTHIQ